MIESSPGPLTASALLEAVYDAHCVSLPFLLPAHRHHSMSFVPRNTTREPSTTTIVQAHSHLTLTRASCSAFTRVIGWRPL
jgi:hypothetical protein